MAISDLDGLREGLPTLRWSVHSNLNLVSGRLLIKGAPFTGVCLNAEEDIVSSAQWIQDGVVKGQYKCPFLPATYTTWQTVKSENGISQNDAQTLWLHEGEVFSGVTYSLGSIGFAGSGLCFMESYYESGEFILEVVWRGDGELVELELSETQFQQSYLNDEYRSGFRVSTSLNSSTSFEFALTKDFKLTHLEYYPGYIEEVSKFCDRNTLGIYSTLDCVVFKDIAEECAIVGAGIPIELLNEVLSQLKHSECKTLTIRKMNVSQSMLDTLNSSRNLERIVVSGVSDQELDRIAERLQHSEVEVGVERRVFSR